MKRHFIFEETDSPTESPTEEPKASNENINPKPEPVAEIQVTNLMVSLHNKAIEEAQKINPNYSIFNTMADGDGKKGTFYGGGDHLIMVVPNTEEGFNNKDFKTVAVDMIKTYTQWFCGPDEASKVKLESVFAHMIEKTEDEKEKEQKEDNEKEENEDKDLENPDDDDDEDGDNDEDKDNDDEEGGEDKPEHPSESVSINNLVNFLFETTQEEDEEIAKEQGMKIDGYYIQYKADVGDKKSKLDSSMKRLTKMISKGAGKAILGAFKKVFGAKIPFGIKFGSGKTIQFGNPGKAILKGADIALGASKRLSMLNKIDKDKTKEKFEQELSMKYPKLSHQISVKTSKEIQEEYRDRLSKADYRELSNTIYCLTVFFDTNSLGYKNITKQKLADMATKSMSASLLDKAFRLHKITSDDVILLNNVGNKDEQGAEKTRASNISTKQTQTQEEPQKGKRGRPRKKRSWMNSSLDYTIPNDLMNILFEKKYDKKVNYKFLFEDGEDDTDDFGYGSEKNADSPDDDNVIEKSKVVEEIKNISSKLKSETLGAFQSKEENHIRCGIFESENFLEAAKKSDTLSNIMNQIDNIKSKYVVASSIRFNKKQLEDETLLKESLQNRTIVAEEYSIIQVKKSDKYSSKVADAMENVIKKNIPEGELDHIYRTYIRNKDEKGFSVMYVYSGWNKYNDIEILDDKEEKEGSQTDVYDNETGEDLYIIPLGKTLDDKDADDSEKLVDDRKKDDDKKSK